MKKMIKSLVAMFSIASVCPLTFEQDRLITHVKKSIDDATLEKSNITQDVLNLEGMSSPKVRHLLNNICSLPNAHYLEIGVWKGSTFVAALYENKHIASAVAIDNWSEFGAPRTTLFSNVTRFLPAAPIDIYELDAFTLNKKEAFQAPIDIYFYDGSTTAESVKKALTYYHDSFADTVIVMVDDFNHPPVAQGFEEALSELKYDVLFEQVLPANFNGDNELWWNGLYVGVLAKNGAGRRPAVLEDKATLKKSLHKQYEFHSTNWSPIVQHMPTLKKYAAECSSVMELGVFKMASTWALLSGLLENKSVQCSYLGVDIAAPPAGSLNLAQRITKALNIGFKFLLMNDMELTDDMVPEVDLLFIDSLHTYCHLTYELEKFSPKVKKYILMHDTSAPWGNTDDEEYKGDYSEYPAYIDRTKRGLWPAVEDFLANHPEWELEIRYFNCFGFTVLKRVEG